MSRKNSVANTVDDPTIPWVTLTLRGTDYKLAYSFNALAKAEALTGLNFFQGFNIDSPLTAVQLRALLWASMTKAQPELTIDEVGELIANLADCHRAMEAISRAWVASFPKPDPDSKNVQAG